MTVGQKRESVFVCDDQMEVREALRLLLKSNGYVVETFASPSDLLSAAQRTAASLILLDMNYTRDTTSGAEGLGLIGRLREARVAAPLIAMTAWGDISLAVAAMQSGASDFIEKPWNNDRLLQLAAKWCAAQTGASKELESARKVQQSLLPRAAPRLGGLEVACRFLPAREVSGDYYDFFEKRAGHFGLVVADVSGKGIPAAMLMSNLQGLFRSLVPQNSVDPAGLLRAVNRQFHESTAPEAFASVFYADFEEGSKELRYVNCGHPAGMLWRANGQMETLAATAMVIGAFGEWDGEVGRVQLGTGDRLLIVSDGAMEAQRVDSAGEQEFGEERLWQLLADTAGFAPHEALGVVENEVVAFSGVSLYDDCTLCLLAIR